ncbi:MAG TPA: glycosyltransferase, partial [Streptosporangiaceae bacterium]|nr:glycosyltransferase [Streptosporangiaceae bacterium]
MKLSIVILTMGNRPAELDRAVASTAALRDAGSELVVVGNGADVPLQAPLGPAESSSAAAESGRVPAESGRVA